MSNFFARAWTPADDERLRVLYTFNDMSASQCAQRLDRSRSSVMGRVKRLGLRHTTGVVRRTPRAPPTPGISFFDLKTHHCRWPLGDGPAVFFCGAARVPPSSYCPRHLEEAYRR